MRTINQAEVNSISGGMRMAEFADGLGMFAGACLGLALAPEAAIGLGAVLAFGAVTGAGDLLMGDSFNH